MSAARDITVAARVPRAVFVDFPHGHTTGRLGDPGLTVDIVRSALGLLASAEPEQVVDLGYHWADDDSWKDSVYLARVDESGDVRMRDDRSPRVDTPQYQLDTDADAAAASHAGEECLVCAGIDF